MKNILWTKLQVAKCVIQSFSSLITEKFMKTVIPYRWVIQDVLKYLKIDI